MQAHSAGPLDEGRGALLRVHQLRAAEAAPGPAGIFRGGAPGGPRSEEAAAQVGPLIFLLPSGVTVGVGDWNYTDYTALVLSIDSGLRLFPGVIGIGFGLRPGFAVQVD